MVEEEDVIIQQPSVEEDGLVEKTDKMALSATPQSPSRCRQCPVIFVGTVVVLR